MVCDGKGRPLLLHLSEGQVNNHKTAAAVIQDLPSANYLLADRAFSSAAFRQALIGRGITPCIPPHASHRIKDSYDPVLYRQRHKIENLFARLKDWRRIHTRYDRCAHTFLSAIAFAATFIFWINEFLTLDGIGLFLQGLNALAVAISNMTLLSRSCPTVSGEWASEAPAAL